MLHHILKIYYSKEYTDSQLKIYYIVFGISAENSFWYPHPKKSYMKS